MSDATTFIGFMKDKLPGKLLRDIQDLCIFNESDLHSASWFYIKEYFRNRSDHSAENIYVCCEPKMAIGRKNKKPDIVVFNKNKPVYFVEFKIFTRSRNEFDLDRKKINQDLKKLQKYAERCPDFKRGFLACVFDADEVYEVDMDEYDSRLSLVSINLKRHETGRLRKYYDQWRSRFDELKEAHRL